MDTREQDTPALRKRLAAMGCSHERVKLEYGNYSVKCNVPNGGDMDLSTTVCIERKMSLDELFQNYTRGRGRFVREFERAKQAGAKIYLLIENGSWEHVYSGSFRTKTTPQAMIASMTAWLARYQCQLLFCKPETTGVLIKEILYRELKERLEGGE